MKKRIKNAFFVLGGGGRFSEISDRLQYLPAPSPNMW